MNKIWILEEEYNLYNQMGEYFIAAFSREPTEDDLLEFGRDHFGRVNNEESWVNKRLVKCRS